MLRAKEKFDGKDINGREIRLVNDMARGSASPRRERARSRDRRRCVVLCRLLVKRVLSFAAVVVHARARSRAAAVVHARARGRVVARRVPRHASRTVAARRRVRTVASEFNVL